jgi:hypothetical protein
MSTSSRKKRGHHRGRRQQEAASDRRDAEELAEQVAHGAMSVPETMLCGFGLCIESS